MKCHKDKGTGYIWKTLPCFPCQLLPESRCSITTSETV